MRKFKTKLFNRWAVKEGLTDAVLLSALKEIVQGLVDANLGGHVYKKRVRMDGRGKRGGARTLIAYKAKDKAFFIYGYAKNEKENIEQKALEVLKELAANLLDYTEAQITKALQSGELKEIEGDEEND